jgi:hypothetical protein
MTTPCDRAFDTRTEHVSREQDEPITLAIFTGRPLIAAIIQHLSPLGDINCTTFYRLFGYSVDVVEVENVEHSTHLDYRWLRLTEI